jgi:hypothetical protein
VKRLPPHRWLPIIGPIATGFWCLGCGWHKRSDPGSSRTPHEDGHCLGDLE